MYTQYYSNRLDCGLGNLSGKATVFGDCSKWFNNFNYPGTGGYNIVIQLAYGDGHSIISLDPSQVQFTYPITSASDYLNQFKTKYPQYLNVMQLGNMDGMLLGIIGGNISRMKSIASNFSSGRMSSGVRDQVYRNQFISLMYSNDLNDAECAVQSWERGQSDFPGISRADINDEWKQIREQASQNEYEDLLQSYQNAQEQISVVPNELESDLINAINTMATNITAEGAKKEARIQALARSTESSNVLQQALVRQYKVMGGHGSKVTSPTGLTFRYTPSGLPVATIGGLSGCPCERFPRG